MFISRVVCRRVSFVVLAGVLMSSLPALRAQQPSDTTPFVAGEVIVQFRDGVDEPRRAAVRAAHAATLSRQYGEVRIERLSIPAAANPIAVAQALSARPEVEAAQPNYLRQGTSFAAPNDTYYGSLWGLTAISASAAWSAYGPGTDTVVVADIDTGVDYTHPDLAGNMWTNPGEIAANGVDDDHNGYVDDVHGIDAANNDGDPADDHWHGTHTAGTFGAISDNAYGVTGVAGRVKVLACKFLTPGNGGTDGDAIECFNYVIAMKQRGVNVRVTSNSWGALRGGYFPSALKNAIDAAGNAGIVNVFAAGNDGVNTDATPYDPASFTSDSIVSVAASDPGDARAGWSNYGAASVDLAAPGVDILSTYPGGFAWASGTSMATPHVAGVAALLLAQRPSLSVAGVKSALMSGVDALPQWAGVVASGGRLNAYLALGGGSSNAAPTVALTGPSSGQSVAAPASIQLSANASDSDGSVTRVDFFVNGGFVGSTANAPHTVTWNESNPGTYTVTATAYDNAGASATSQPVTIEVTGTPPPVSALPQVMLSAPLEGTVVVSGSLVTLTAEASDADDGVAYVEFYVGNTRIATASTAPYSTQWTAPSQGWYSLTARAYDHAGQTAVSPAVRIRVKRR